MTIKPGEYNRTLSPAMAKALNNIKNGLPGDHGLVTMKEKGGYTRTYYALRKRGLVTAPVDAATKITDKGLLALTRAKDWRV